MYDGIPYEWDFQLEIPVVHSELVIEPSRYVTYQKNYFGYIPLTLNTSSRWVSQDVPAFKIEPYMTSSKNYRSRFEFDVSNISFPGYFRAIASTWPAVRDFLYGSTYFGTVLESDSYIKASAKEIKSRCTTRGRND